MGFVDDFSFGMGKLVCYSSATLDVGKTVKVTDGTTTWSAVYDSSLSAAFFLPGRTKYTVSLISGDATQFSTSVIFNYGEYKEINVGVSKDSWAGVKNIISAGLEASMISIGDTMPAAAFSGESIEFIPVAIDLESAYGHSVIFAAKNCMKSPLQMQTSNTNAGGYASTLIAKYLDGDFYAGINSDLKNVITKRSFKASTGSQSSNLQTEDHYIWLPREFEIFGTTTYAAATERSAGGANQFPYFATAANRVKTLGKGGSTCAWWESSPYVSNSNTFCVVDSAGGANNDISSRLYGVLPCFMIAAG